MQIQTVQTFKVDGKTFNSAAEAEAYVALKEFEVAATAFVVDSGLQTKTITVGDQERANPHFNTAVKAVALYMKSQAAE